MGTCTFIFRTATVIKLILVVETWNVNRSVKLNQKAQNAYWMSKLHICNISRTIKGIKLKLSEKVQMGV